MCWAEWIALGVALRVVVAPPLWRLLAASADGDPRAFPAAGFSGGGVGVVSDWATNFGSLFSSGVFSSGGGNAAQDPLPRHPEWG